MVCAVTNITTTRKNSLERIHGKESLSSNLILKKAVYDICGVYNRNVNKNGQVIRTCQGIFISHPHELHLSIFSKVACKAKPNKNIQARLLVNVVNYHAHSWHSQQLNHCSTSVNSSSCITETFLFFRIVPLVLFVFTLWICFGQNEYEINMKQYSFTKL